ncbi:phosphotransferase [Erysipelothrix rhusiopathiae]|uniref:phosphotransferase enzyme family protein n=1 Tax=Erysipelothrix sp. strain 2 (EsS2-7-Brazil) TaxID=2500579 RepID=UPI001377D446|nr:aminoglycoside phosphotransferase family protein [Erysipelothrix sp. strain 2 (EsS2-7-Brazil)]MBK2404756.1 aminoglycoside phosphotransferase family protein [Erysipelothrix sp. strain 2 (EsS2-7-Brazil)]NBA01764.1 phosphotransferase [Erysipelothrix rhusiopathiae]
MKSIKEVVQEFCFDGDVVEIVPFGNGHINDTYRVMCSRGSYVLQKINHQIFLDPQGLIENIEKVTRHIRQKVIKRGGDPRREVLNLIPTHHQEYICQTKSGDFWRAYELIENSKSLDLVENKEDFYQSGLAFGAFQKDLEDFPVDTLNLTIEDFHHTPKRYDQFHKSLKLNKSGRKHFALPEIEFALKHQEFADTLWDYHQQGLLPLKVTHNDTKLNNVLLDADSNDVLCVVDLDTVMPGFSLDDFGDSIRFGASTALEDEKDLSKVHLSIPYYEAYVDGFIEGAGGSLSDLEIKLFPEGAKMMTLECGLRFLKDYIDGDVYFKTSYPDHNLVRARTQFKLVQEMDDSWEILKKISATRLKV